MRSPGFLAAVAMVVAFALPVGAGLFRVWVHQSAVQMGYRLSEEARRRTKLLDLSRKLELELAAARSPDRLVRLARELGLERPGPDRVLGRQGGRP